MTLPLGTESLACIDIVTFTPALVSSVSACCCVLPMTEGVLISVIETCSSSAGGFVFEVSDGSLLLIV